MNQDFVPKRANQIVEFVQGFIDEHQYSPSVREIAEGVGLKGPGAIQATLQQMIRQRLLTGEPNKSRTIRVGDAVIRPRTETM